MTDLTKANFRVTFDIHVDAPTAAAEEAIRFLDGIFNDKERCERLDPKSKRDIGLIVQAYKTYGAELGITELVRQNLRTQLYSFIESRLDKSDGVGAVSVPIIRIEHLITLPQESTNE